MEFGFSQTKRKFKDKCENLNENKIAQIFRLQHKNKDVENKKREIQKKTANNTKYINRLHDLQTQQAKQI